MSGGRTEDPHDPANQPYPSMEDILASIRRILNEDPEQIAEAAEPPATPAGEDVLVLDAGMLVPDLEPAPPPTPSPPSAPEPEIAPAAVFAATPPPQPQDGLLAPEAATAAGNAMSELALALAAQRQSLIHRGGPTIEDLVREELRPLLKSWLDTHLPPLVERLVRAEIERLGVGRLG